MSIYDNSIAPIENEKKSTFPKSILGKRKRKPKPQQPRKRRKLLNQDEIETLETKMRTIKVENIPFHSSKKLKYYEKKFRHMFSKFGSIESIRFRNIPIQKPEHLKHKNLPIFACIRKGYVSSGMISCFIKFSDAESANQSSQEMNESSFEGSLLFVHCLGSILNTNNEHKLYIGNLPFDMSKEELFEQLKKKESLIDGKIVDIKLPIFQEPKDSVGNEIKKPPSSLKLQEHTEELLSKGENAVSIAKTKNNMGYAVVTFEKKECVDNFFTRKINISYKGKRFRFKRFHEPVVKKKKVKTNKRTKKNKKEEKDKEEEENEKEENFWWMGNKSSNEQQKKNKKK